MLEYSRIIHKKLMYISEHSGDGATIHETALLANIIINYAHLVEKETKSPIMGTEKLEYYKNKLKEYTEKGEKFLSNMVTMV